VIGQVDRDPHMGITDLPGLVQTEQLRQLLGQMRGLHQPCLRIIRRPAQLARHLLARPLLHISRVMHLSQEVLDPSVNPRPDPGQLRKAIKLLITRAIRRIHPQQPLDLPRHKSNTRPGV
jgi:hypothetical protein